MTEPLLLDRRQRRRQETIAEILTHAVDMMAEEGVAGLSLGEVARRMGIRTPSLYGYFSSKHALYDAVFEQGANDVLAELSQVYAELSGPAAVRRTPLPDQLLRAGRSIVSWSLNHPVHAQLLYWRPVPGFQPSGAAYAPAVTLVSLTRAWFQDLHDEGLLLPDADVDAVMRDWIVLIAGVVSQQLANAPHQTDEHGQYTAALPSLIDMFVTHYGATHRRRTPATPRPGRKVPHAHQG